MRMRLHFAVWTMKLTSMIAIDRAAMQQWRQTPNDPICPLTSHHSIGPDGGKCVLLHFLSLSSFFWKHFTNLSYFFNFPPVHKKYKWNEGERKGKKYIQQREQGIDTSQSLFWLDREPWNRNFHCCNAQKKSIELTKRNAFFLRRVYFFSRVFFSLFLSSM